jgi:hypothetical protein
LGQKTCERWNNEALYCGKEFLVHRTSGTDVNTVYVMTRFDCTIKHCHH